MKLNSVFVFTSMPQLMMLGLLQTYMSATPSSFWLLAGRKLSSLFLVSASVCASVYPSEMQSLEFVNPTSEKTTCREKQRCLHITELDKHLHFSDSENKSNKERNPLMNSSLASLHPAHLMLK